MVISRSGFPRGRRSIKTFMIWSYMVHYIANCISVVDSEMKMKNRLEHSYIFFYCAQCMYVQHVFWLQRMHMASASGETLQTHTVRFAAQLAEDVEIHGGRHIQAELISHSGREGSETRPPVSYCKMKCLRSFVNVLIDLCPQTGKSGVVSRRLFSTPRDAFISCCWPALHPHYWAALPHTLPDCCNNFRHFYLPASPPTARTVWGLNIKCEALL